MTDEPLKRIGFPEKQDSYLSRARKERKMADEPIHCKICGSPSITNQSEQLCYICDEKEPPLKTLKDLGRPNFATDDGRYRCMGCLNPEYTDLRAEAIRWAKSSHPLFVEFEKHLRHHLHMKTDEVPEDRLAMMFLEWAFKRFFNLTEEDLLTHRCPVCGHSQDVSKVTEQCDLICDSCGGALVKKKEEDLR
jgi:rubrerythrin